MSEPPAVRIDALGPDEWARYRDIRLAALRDTPKAYGSTLERELDLEEAQWRPRSATAAIAVRDGQDVGLVCWYESPDDPPDTLHLVAMWVHPDARGTGAAQPLVGWVLDIARARPDKERVALNVATWNAVAIRLYERCGFLPTGRTCALPSFPDILEIEMVCEL